MPRNIISLLLPPFVGILLVIIFLQIREACLTYLYPNYYADTPFLFQPLFDVTVFLPVYVVVYFGAIVFQLFVGLGVWKIYQEEQTIIRLRLWQLTMICCLLFGTCLELIVQNGKTEAVAIIINILTCSLLAAIYWYSNFMTLHFIEHNK